MYLLLMLFIVLINIEIYIFQFVSLLTIHVVLEKFDKSRSVFVVIVLGFVCCFVFVCWLVFCLFLFCLVLLTISGTWQIRLGLDSHFLWEGTSVGRALLSFRSVAVAKRTLSCSCLTCCVATDATCVETDSLSKVPEDDFRNLVSWWHDSRQFKSRVEAPNHF